MIQSVARQSRNHCLMVPEITLLPKNVEPWNIRIRGWNKKTVNHSKVDAAYLVNNSIREDFSPLPSTEMIYFSIQRNFKKFTMNPRCPRAAYILMQS